MAKTISSPKNELLKWITDLAPFFERKSFALPRGYRERVIAVKRMLDNDSSGIVNTVLDFAINAALVRYEVQTGNKTLTKTLNNWLKNLNSDVRGLVPTGVEALAKEYFRERWKGSSNLLLRTFWTTAGKGENAMLLPTTLYFVDGEDILLKNDPKKPISLGDEKYALRVGNNKEDAINLPESEDERIFVQKPFESWGTREPIPYLMKRGMYHNLSFMNILISKGEFVVNNAMEYLFLIKKGTEKMALEGRPEFTYDENDLKGISQDLKDLLMKVKSEGGLPSYATNFDTQVEHLIPEYERILKSALYAPVEKRLLAGLGLVDIIEGSASTRRESILNPKPFIGEINQGVNDFKALLTDIIYEIIKANEESHPKWMNTRIDINPSTIKGFTDTKVKEMLRSAYDRGVLSKRTFTETVVEQDYDIERQRRVEEKEDGDEELMFAPVIQNIEGAQEGTQPGKKSDTKEDAPADKKAAEKKNFTNASIECPVCEEPYLPEQGQVVCDSCEGNVLTSGSPFLSNSDLPSELSDLPTEAKSIWREAFNVELAGNDDDAEAIQQAWKSVRNKFKKDKDKWVPK